MALFAIMHVVAYPWKPYDIRRTNRHEAGSSITMDKSNYQGGPLGIKAYLDAFNPWDLIKAIGRGFKWVAVGHRRREEDISYKQDIAAMPLQTMTQTGGGNYQQLDDTTANEEHGTYEPYNGHPASRTPLTHDHVDQSATAPQWHQEEDGFVHVPSQQQQQQYSVGTAHPGFQQDTGYHAPTTGQTVYMPEESQYYNPRTR